jgi:cyclase
MKKNSKPKRILAKIDVKWPYLVKGINYEGLRVLGLPSKFINQYQKDGIDEIIINDVTANLFNRQPNFTFLEEVSSHLYLPLIYQGGLRSLFDIEQALKHGADRISINSQFIKHPKFIEEAVKNFGASTIIASIEVNKMDGVYKCFYENGREESKYEVVEWIKMIQDFGVGEIHINSISFEGLCDGGDIDLLKFIEKEIQVPLIYNGGIGDPMHAIVIFRNSKIDGISVSSLFHYYYLSQFRHDESLNPEMGNLEFLNLKNNYFDKTESIVEFKNKLKQLNYDVRSIV